MAWNLMPQHQQRGSQLGDKPRSAPREAVEGRAAQEHDLADLEVAGTTEPQRAIDYPADRLPEREGDITPTLGDGDTQSWDDVVQPENHARQAQPQGEAREAGAGDDEEPLPEGK